MFGKFLRPLRRSLAQRGLRTSMLKNPGEGGFAGIAVSWREPNRDRLVRCSLATVREEERNAYFLVADEDDLIQRELVNGRFYEPEELAIISRHFSGGTFVDIGANIGNHSVYAGLFLQAERIIAIEPNPLIVQLLRHNLALNELSQRSPVHEVGLSDSSGTARIEIAPGHNMGAARLKSDTTEGSIALVRGDELLAEEVPSFIKVDTEGYEVKVLAGLAQTLARHRPALFVEVEDANRTAVEALLAPLGYVQMEQFGRYPGLANYLYKVDGAASTKA